MSLARAMCERGIGVTDMQYRHLRRACEAKDPMAHFPGVDSVKTLGHGDFDAAKEVILSDYPDLLARQW